MGFFIAIIIAFVVVALFSLAKDSAQKAENESFENSMSDIDTSEKYHSENWKVGMLYDRTKKKARIINYETKQYEDIEGVELGFASAFFSTVVFSNSNESTIIFASYPKEKNAKLKMSKIENFQADKFIRNRNCGNGYGILKMGLESCVMIDGNNKKMLVLNDIEQPSEKRIVRFNDIISVEIIENGTTVFSKSTTRTIGGSVVGNVLMGGAGAVVGGLSGNTRKADKVDSISVKILVRDVENPTIMLPLHKGNDIDTSKDEYKNIKDFANEIKDVVSVIIDAEDKGNPNTKIEQSASTNITDELIKIAKLKENGLLTDEEFSMMKSKLLN